MSVQKELSLLAMIRETDMVAYLQSLGYEPAAIKKNGTDYWYLSPLRNECEPSFHVNRATNEWYDFPLAAGGNMVDFCLRYYGCSVGELLLKYDADFSLRGLPVFDSELYGLQVPRASKLVVTEVRNLYAYPLKNYLHERSIPVSVANLVCKEVSYEISGRSYYGIGFKNDAGGWELRNKNFKQSSSPKDITTLRFGAPSVQVFEGFMDFLSYRALHPYQEPGTTDFVVLNGAGMFERALPFLEHHERVGLWLDRDVTGQAYTQYAISLGSKYRDESGLYSRHKDLNDWLIHKGEVQKLALKPGNRLRPVG
jgi:DNA primase